MMVVAWKMSLSVKSPFEWKERLKFVRTKFQPFGVEVLAFRNRIELESSDLSISSRYNRITDLAGHTVLASSR
jgi:hypothetical protein